MQLKKIIGNINHEDKILNCIHDMVKIHKYTKHYLLIAEELAPEGETFLQPVKEHRDAYEHIMRVFSESNYESESESLDYILDNFEKALGHEYRAFFDTADWLTFICRKSIREALSNYKFRKLYKEKYHDFEETKSFINNIGFKIAEHREKKDIGKSEEHMQQIEDYIKTLNELLELYQKVASI